MATIHLEEDEDEVPFSMADLLNSFENKATDHDVDQILKPVVSFNHQIEALEDAHLVDDPALWPSITKIQESPVTEPEDLRRHRLIYFLNALMRSNIGIYSAITMVPTMPATTMTVIGSIALVRADTADSISRL